MRTWLFLSILLVASACSSSVVLGEQADNVDAQVQETPLPAVDEAAAEPVATPDPNATPEVYTDELGDWYVPPAGAAASEADRAIRTVENGAETVAAINALVPADRMLAFELQAMTLTDDGHRALALAPVAWDRDTDDEYDHDYENELFDFFTSYEVDTGCQGFCAPQQWEELMNDPSNSPLRIRNDQPIEIMVNQTLTNPAGRLLVVDRSAVETGGTSISVEVVRWSNDADRFFECTARLGETDRSLWPAFADACLAAEAEWLNS